MTEFQIEAGAVFRHADFSSRYISPRHVDVWVPQGYTAGDQNRWPVLYMHDGQNIFDPELAYTGIDWGVDEAITRLMDAGRIRGAIVVGVWNTPQRWREYMPQKPYEQIENESFHRLFRQQAGGDSFSDLYLKFLVEELKPFIDASYRTQPEQEHTFVMGSSMGGLISLYALSQYPHIFGGAGCLSTHWPLGGYRLVDSMASALPKPGAHRLYFDYGTETLDWNYERFQKRMDRRLAEAGYVQGKDCLTQKFPGHEHTERDWRARLEIPLEFLLR
jgi:predicted alpha/beta superfamily hydrolase